MTPKLKIDRAVLHELLWDKRDRNNKVRVLQKDLAEEIGVTPATMCSIMAEMVKTGRVRKIGTQKGNIGLYSIRDPATIEPKVPPPPPTLAQRLAKSR